MHSAEKKNSYTNGGEHIMRFKNKVVLITAAASGMGRAGALLFAEEGAKVVAVDVDEAGVALPIDGGYLAK